jgi:hypothetical protein
MAQKKQDQDQEHGVQGMKWDQRHQELGAAIVDAKMDASNVDMPGDDEKQVKQHLDQAYLHHASVPNDPGKEDEHIKAGFGHVGKARGIIGKSSVQSDSYRRHQWPFLPPGMD